MKSRFFSAKALAGFGIACAVALTSPAILQAVLGSPAHADEAKPSISPEVSKPLVAAKAALEAKNYAEALNQLKEADAVSKKTAYDEAIIEQLRLIAGLGSGDGAVAAKSYSALDASGNLSPDLKVRYAPEIAKAFYRSKDYASAATFAGNYFQAGGNDPQMRILLAHSDYDNNDFANAVKVSNEAIDAYDKSGQKAPESLYQLAGASANKLGDKAAYAAVLERLTAAYPKPEYWADLVHQVAVKQGVSGKLDLDLYRLQDAVGALKSAGQYAEYADAANQAGLPGEAKTVMEKAYSAGLPTTGADAQAYSKLRDSIQRAATSDQAGMTKAEAEAAKQPNGQALVSTGMDYYGYGQNDKAVSLIQAGIAKGGLKNPDEAKLHLGIAQLAAGNKAEAVATFKSISSAEPINTFARLWTIKADS